MEGKDKSRVVAQDSEAKVMDVESRVVDAMKGLALPSPGVGVGDGDMDIGRRMEGSMGCPSADRCFHRSEQMIER